MWKFSTGDPQGQKFIDEGLLSVTSSGAGQYNVAVTPVSQGIVGLQAGTYTYTVTPEVLGQDATGAQFTIDVTIVLTRASVTTSASSGNNRLTRQTHYRDDTQFFGCRITEKRGYRKANGRRSDSRSSGVVFGRERFLQGTGLALPEFYVRMQRFDSDIAAGATLQMHRVDYNYRKCVARANTVTDNTLGETSSLSADGRSWKSEVTAAPFSISYTADGRATRIQSNRLYVSINDAAGSAYACCILRQISETTFNT